MKKLLAIALAVALVFALSVAASAQNSTITNTTSPQSTAAVISTTIDPTYTVTIPGDTPVSFGTLSTDFGSVKLESAKLNPGYAVKVELTTDYDYLLENQADTTKTIPYAIKAGDDAFTSAYYTTAGQSTALTINITAADWNAAYAGEYRDTVTFTISYVTPTNGEDAP